MVTCIECLLQYDILKEIDVNTTFSDYFVDDNITFLDCFVVN